MALGIKDFQFALVDLVKVISDEITAITCGTISFVTDICPGPEIKYQIDGYESLYIEAKDLEIVSYVRIKAC